jgi:hypothetical protein
MMKFDFESQSLTMARVKLIMARSKRAISFLFGKGPNS